MKVVVGLGNPGGEYEQSRHNMGFMVISRLAERLGGGKWKSQCEALVLKLQGPAGPVVLAMPQTYMNLSGHSVKALLGFYKVDQADWLVAADDLDLEPGRIRARDSGGHGGHNGLRSIIEQMGTRKFKRVRVGIGKPVTGSVVSHVLGRTSREESEILAAAVEQAVDFIIQYLESGRFENWSSP